MAGGGGGGRQIYVSNVCYILSFHSNVVVSCLLTSMLASLHRGMARFEGLVPSSW